MKILTINARPETFESKLPHGAHGSPELLEMLSVDNVKSVSIDNIGEYEENMDAEYRVVFNNGDEIHYDGYSGLWELKSYDSLIATKKVAVLNNLRDHLADLIEEIAEDQ